MEEIGADVELKEFAFDALREMYSEAEPPLDFDEVKANPDEYPEDWYQQHSLARDRQREIVDKHCEKHDLSDRERTTITWIAILDLGPAHPPDSDNEGN